MGNFNRQHRNGCLVVKCNTQKMLIVFEHFIYLLNFYQSMNVQKGGFALRVATVLIVSQHPWVLAQTFTWCFKWAFHLKQQCSQREVVTNPLLRCSLFYPFLTVFFLCSFYDQNFILQSLMCNYL